MRMRSLLFLLPALLLGCKSEPQAAEPVAAPKAQAAAPTPTPTNEAGQIEIEANAKGFTPSKIWVEEGKPVKLLFTRTVEKTCMDGVVFPALGIEKELAVGEPVEIEFTPEAAGDIRFQCPMGHGKSSVVVLPKSS